MDQGYYFYLSYERSECDGYMERFFRDLIAEVSSISGVSQNRAAFLDKHAIGARDDWSGATKAGLEASRTLVAMFSPAYFSRPTPLQEFELFRSRVDDAVRDGRPASLILPVLWAPRDLLRNAPPAADEFLSGSGEYPPEFVEEGLRWVMRRGGRYKLFVSTLADKIVRAAEASVLPESEVSSVPPPVAPPYVDPPSPSETSAAGRLQAFLCHASGDKPRVRELCGKLKADGVDPWLDEERLLPGHRWEDEIRKALKSSHAAIVCLSEHALSKVGYIHRELKHVLDVAAEQPRDSLFLMPIKLDDCGIPDGLEEYHATSLFEPQGYARLKNALDLRAYQLNLERTRWRTA